MKADVSKITETILGIERSINERWVDEAFQRSERTLSVRPNEELSFQGAVVVPESYRIDESRKALRGVSNRSFDGIRLDEQKPINI